MEDILWNTYWVQVLNQSRLGKHPKNHQLQVYCTYMYAAPPAYTGTQGARTHCMACAFRASGGISCQLGHGFRNVLRPSFGWCGLPIASGGTGLWSPGILFIVLIFVVYGKFGATQLLASSICTEMICLHSSNCVYIANATGFPVTFHKPSPYYKSSPHVRLGYLPMLKYTQKYQVTL
jgi:hypothetical protein